MTDDLDWIALAGKRAKGKRPEYFDDFAIDRLMSIVMALVAEVSVVRQRLDTIGADAIPCRPDKLTVLIRSETQKWGDVVRRANIKA